MSDIPYGLPKKKRPMDGDIYAIKVPKEMKARLVELKLFYGVDVAKWVRTLIQEALNKIDKTKTSVEL